MTAAPDIVEKVAAALTGARMLLEAQVTNATGALKSQQWLPSRAHIEGMRNRAQEALDEVNEALAAIEAATPAWQPIATFAEVTAMTSGEGVLIAEPDGRVGEAYYRNFGDEDDGWWWANTSWGDYPTPERPMPIHWQPLPTPPRNLTDG